MGTRSGRLRNVVNRLCPGTVVLCYHRVTDLPVDPFEIAVTPALFADHLALIRSVAEPVPLDRVASHAGRGGSPLSAWRLRRRVVVTFDDGYADNLEQARPLLERHGVPATVFLTSHYVAQTEPAEEFWWDELERWATEAAGPPHVPAVGTDRWRRLHGKLGRLAPVPRRAALDRLWRLGGRSRPSAARPTHRPLTADQARRLIDAPLVSAGAHTVHHCMLPAVADAVRRAEVAQSRATLTALLGRPVSTFAYPFGWYDSATVEAVRAAGFSAAATIVPVAARPRSDPLLIPRLMVGHWDAEELGRRLHAAFTTG